VKSVKFQEAHKALSIPSGVKPLAWRVAGLLIVGLVILAINCLLNVNQPVAESSATPSAPVAAPEKSIAVLPFESLSENKSDGYFAAGVQEEILSKLACLSQLKVISRTSVMVYQPQSNRDVRSIGAALGVAHLVEGTVRRDANRVRITTELIDARTDQTLWSESYQRDLTDIFAIQNEIAEAVASKLNARLLPEEQNTIEQRPTTNLEAYDLYLQAKELIANWGYVHRPDDLPKAIKLLEEATGKDPKFTLAYCLLVRAHDDLYHYHVDKTPERRALADAAVQEALRLEPDNPEVHFAEAYHLYESYRDYEQAGIEIKLAQKDRPNSVEALWLAARIDRRLGRLDESTKALEAAYSLDPRNPELVDGLQLNYLWQGRVSEAEQMEHRFFELEPDNPFRKPKKVWYAFFRTGDATAWRAALEELPASTKVHGPVASARFWAALYSRDWTATKQILGENPDEDLLFGAEALVPLPRQCGEIYLAALEGKHPTIDAGFGAARNQVAQRFEAHPDDVELLSVLGVIDAFLGRKDKAIEEATRAVQLRPISQDAVEGPWILQNLAIVYAWTNELAQAFGELAILVKNPAGPTRAGFKADPAWDPLRKDPRFEELAAQIPE
jgi:TolB-like protein/Flp pilus assembly protein TadD